MINDIEYWKKRHKSLQGKIAAVGQRSFSDKANLYAYKIVKEQYRKVLKRIDAKSGTKVLDAGAGIGMYLELLLEHGFEVTACDVSQIALSAIKIKKIIKICSAIDNIDLPNGSFDIVHSFDVLFHILDDKKWEESVKKMCSLSNRYVILHERFPRYKQLISSKHLNMRTYKQTSSLLNENSFYEVLSIPTHFWASLLPIYRITNFFPSFFYKLDRLTIDFIDKLSFKNFGSSYIKVFERRKS